MKLLKLIIVDLLSFAREKSVVFILLVIGLIMSSFSTIYYFSVRKTINETWGDGSIKYSSVSFEFPQDINSGALTSFVNVLEGIENMPYNEYKLFLLDTNSYNSMDDKFLESSRTLPTEYKTNPDFKYTYPRGVIGMMDSKGLVTEWPIMEGRGLTKEDSACNVALADMDCNIGDKLSFYDQEFEVVGLMQKNFNRMFPLYIIIRGEYYLSSNIPCRYINIRFEKVPTKQLVDALCAEVKKLNQDVQSYLPEELSETTVLNEANEFIKTISIIIISLLYIFALFRYWIIDSIKQYAIYRCVVQEE